MVLEVARLMIDEEGALAVLSEETHHVILIFLASQSLGTPYRSR
jgi:hypothetical protein